MARLEVFLAGQLVNLPKEADDLALIADFQDEIQGDLSTKNFTVSNEFAKAIRDHIDAGMNGGVGIFESPSIEFKVTNEDGTSYSLDAYVDLTEYQENNPVSLELAVKRDDSLENLSTRAQATTFALLEYEDVITQSDYVDVDFLVEKEADPLTITTILITLYIFQKELSEAIRKLAISIAEGVRAVGNLPFNIGDIAFAAINIVLNLAYTAFMLVQLINLGKTLISYILSPSRVHKATTYRKLLEKSLTYFGYSLVTSLDELDNYTYLPSNTSQAGTKGFLQQTFNVGDDIQILSGIPSSNDFGYFVWDFYKVIERTFNARFAIIGTEVHVRPLNDPFWTAQASYQIPGNIQDKERKIRNTGDIVKHKAVKYVTDPQDSYTTSEYRGVNYTVTTEPINSVNEKRVSIRGLDEVNINLSLGKCKKDLTFVEETLKGVAQVLDSVINFFGGTGDNAAKITNRIGRLVISQERHSVAKALYLDNGKIPPNHRDLLSAKYSYETYHTYDSFVANPDRQRYLYPESQVPFSLDNFINLLYNSYCTNEDGDSCKATKIVYTVRKGKATIDYWRAEQYTNNLKEVKYEPA